MYKDIERERERKRESCDRGRTAADGGRERVRK